jgi:hypothetical protein
VRGLIERVGAAPLLGVVESQFLLWRGAWRETLLAVGIHQWGSVIRGASPGLWLGDCLRQFKMSEVVAGSSGRVDAVLAIAVSQPTA